VLLLAQLQDGFAGVGEINIEDRWQDAATSVSFWEIVPGIYENKANWNM
jgi:hypothetical protein